MTAPTSHKNARLLHFQDNQSSGRRKTDWLLIGGVALSPVTALSFGPLNIGEWLTLLWCFITLLGLRDTTPVSRFDVLWWCLFSVTLTTGTLVGLTLYPDQTQASQLLTWVYFGIVFLSITTGLSSRTIKDILDILNRIGIYSLLIHTVLLTYSYVVSPTLFGIDLWYKNARFAGGGSNPHYVSLLTLVAMFITFRLLWRTPKIWHKLPLAALLCGGAWIAWATDSTTITTSVIATIAVLMGAYLVQAKRIGLLWSVFGMLFIALAFQAQRLEQMLLDVIASDPNGGERIEIWLSYFETFNLSHLFGLGPGTHAQDGSIEYHNLYLEFLAMAGIAGLLLLLVLLWYTCVGAFRLDLLLAGPVLALMFYGFGGFSGRRLVFWVVLSLIIGIIRKTGESQVCYSLRSESSMEQQTSHPVN